MNESEEQQFNNIEPVEKKKRNKNARKIKDIEKAILQQTLIIKQAQEYYDELVNEYNRLSN